MKFATINLLCTRQVHVSHYDFHAIILGKFNLENNFLYRLELMFYIFSPWHLNSTLSACFKSGNMCLIATTKQLNTDSV